MTALVTSIPPSFPSRQIDGRDISDSYQDACIKSWKGLVQEVISVNSRSEIDRFEVTNAGYRMFGVDSDGSVECGKPLVLFNDLIDAAIDCGSEKIVFTNADIFIHKTEELKHLFTQLQPGSALVSRRTNIRSLKNCDGVIYKLGYDLFLIHRADLNALRSSKGLYFGDPWWDYCALCSLLIQGVNVIALDSIHSLHVTHRVAFSKDRWLALGPGAVKQLYRQARRRRLWKTRSFPNSMGNLIIDLCNQVYRCNDPLHLHLLRVLLGRTPGEFDEPSLRRFADELTHYADEILGFESFRLDDSGLANACAALSSSLRN